MLSGVLGMLAGLASWPHMLSGHPGCRHAQVVGGTRWARPTHQMNLVCLLVCWWACWSACLKVPCLPVALQA
jgi:hypothetical protein